MSNSIRDVSLNNQREIHRINHNNQVEKDAIQAAHKKAVHDLKLHQEKEIFDKKQVHNKQMIEAQIKKDDTLRKLRNQLADTQHKIEKEIARIRGLSQDQIEQLKDHYADKHQNIQLNNQSTIESQSQKFNQIYTKLKDDLDRGRAIAEQTKQSEMDTIYKNNQTEITRMDNKQNELRRRIDKEHKGEIHFIRKTNKNEKKDRIQSHARTLGNLNKLYNDELQKTQQFKMNQISTEKENFESAFKQEIIKKKESLKKLNDKYLNLVNEIKNNLATNIHKIDTKSNDPFYQIRKFDAKIEDTKDHYLVKIPAKEHEVSNYQVFGQGRNIKLTYARGHEDKVFDGDNETYRTTRNESHTYSVKVDDIIDKNNIAKTFKDDMIIFKVKKA